MLLRHQYSQLDSLFEGNTHRLSGLFDVHTFEERIYSRFITD